MKNFHFLVRPNKKFWSKATIFFEEDRITSMGSNFLGGRPHGADSYISAGVHLNLTPPLRVAIINGWPQMLNLSRLKH